ncbi:MAG: CBS domain-containing protein [Acidobacteriota bacterium]
MAMLSELLRFDIVDAAGKTARPVDLGIGLLDDDYPPVVSIYFNQNGELKRLPWSEVTEFDKPGKGFTVSDLGRAETAGEKDPDGEVLLRRDVLDALIVDLLSRRTTRSSDLQLSPDGGELRLRAVDAGLKAMLRRISRGLYRGARRSDLYDWKYVEFLRGDPQAVESGAGYNMRIGRLSSGEISQIAEYLPYLHAAELLTLLPNHKAALALQAMSIERQLQIIEEFDDEEAVDLLSRMSPDRATDLIGGLGIETMKRFLGMMAKKQREQILKLLQYPEDSAGGQMINNIVHFGRGTMVATAREKLKKHSKDFDFISVVFVTESADNKTLAGTATIRALLEADDSQKLGDVMDPYAATLSPFERSRDAAYKLIGNQVAAMPVTDADGQLVGAMTIEAAIGQTASAGSELRALKVFS